jgi:hydrogenase nickel incorporation protein HypA/HybF
VHELAIAEQIVAIACRRPDAARVTRVVVAVGKLAAVSCESLRFCFDAVTADTLAAGALLEIVETPGRARCRVCGGDVVLERPFGRCACGSSDLAWTEGEDLVVREVETAP